MKWVVEGKHSDIGVVLRGCADKGGLHLTTEKVAESLSSDWSPAHTIIARGEVRINLMGEMERTLQAGDTLPSRQVYSGAISWVVTQDDTVAYCLKLAAKYQGYWHRGAKFNEGDFFSIPFTTGPGLFVLVDGFAEVNDVVYEVDAGEGGLTFFEIAEGNEITIKNSKGVGFILWKHPEGENPEKYSHPFIDTYQRGYREFSGQGS